VKTFVTNKQDKSRVPFLRGILIRNLGEAGLPFEEAYELAGEVRDELADISEISSQELEELVISLLRRKYSDELIERYSSPVAVPEKIGVISLGGEISAFSRGRHQRYLQSSAVMAEDAEKITLMIYNQLVMAGVHRISTSQLGYLTYLCLLQEIGKSAARQYLVWSEFQRSGRPLILLICGAVGSGKSSIATEIGHRLEIVRTQSTDMLREVMRSMIPRRLMPVLHTSSFDAWETLPIQDLDERSLEHLVAEGYRSQAELLALACEAVIQRAVRETTPLILEGVHAQPDLVNTVSEKSGAIVVHVTLAVMRAEELKNRLTGRGLHEPRRKANRYLKKFPSIWALQTYVLGEAERCDTPIIPNDDKEAAINQLVHTVNRELARSFDGSPADVFGKVVNGAKKAASQRTWQEMVTRLVPSEDIGPQSVTKAASSR